MLPLPPFLRLALASPPVPASRPPPSASLSGLPSPALSLVVLVLVLATQKTEPRVLITELRHDFGYMRRTHALHKHGDGTTGARATWALVACGGGVLGTKLTDVEEDAEAAEADVDLSDGANRAHGRREAKTKRRRGLKEEKRKRSGRKGTGEWEETRRTYIQIAYVNTSARPRPLDFGEGMDNVTIAVNTGFPISA
ncbi:hypothetical protein C8R45DRAFT_929431 [Mycena sanguinolenta]|nr:hypothetical protein C8R45DRAFT_929431 [Mycena sanguinolenta]